MLRVDSNANQARGCACPTALALAHGMRRWPLSLSQRREVEVSHPEPRATGLEPEEP